jgi:hypothetical protein
MNAPFSTPKALLWVSAFVLLVSGAAAERAQAQVTHPSLRPVASTRQFRQGGFVIVRSNPLQAFGNNLVFPGTRFNVPRNVNAAVNQNALINPALNTNAMLNMTRTVTVNNTSSVNPGQNVVVTTPFTTSQSHNRTVTVNTTFSSNPAVLANQTVLGNAVVNPALNTNAMLNVTRTVAVNNTSSVNPGQNVLVTPITTSQNNNRTVTVNTTFSGNPALLANQTVLGNAVINPAFNTNAMLNVTRTVAVNNNSTVNPGQNVVVTPFTTSQNNNRTFTINTTFNGNPALLTNQTTLANPFFNTINPGRNFNFNGLFSPGVAGNSTIFYNNPYGYYNNFGGANPNTLYGGGVFGSRGGIYNSLPGGVGPIVPTMPGYGAVPLPAFYGGFTPVVPFVPPPFAPAPVPVFVGGVPPGYYSPY